MEGLECFGCEDSTIIQVIYLRALFYEWSNELLKFEWYMLHRNSLYPFSDTLPWIRFTCCVLHWTVSLSCYSSVEYCNIQQELLHLYLFNFTLLD